MFGVLVNWLVVIGVVVIEMIGGVFFWCLDFLYCVFYGVF